MSNVPTSQMIGNRSVLHVMAAEAEYGEKQQALFAPLITGVGPIEAAISLTRYLCGLENLPDYIISLGSAGSATLHQTGIYQASSVSWRDMDASALGFEKGVTPFLDQPAEIPLGFQIAGLKKARLSTGANIVSGKTYQSIDADMVDMETFALVRVCQNFGIGFIGLRGISDGKEELGHIDDWKRYLHVIDEKLADAVQLVHGAIEQNQWLSS